MNGVLGKGRTRKETEAEGKLAELREALQHFIFCGNIPPKEEEEKKKKQKHC